MIRRSQGYRIYIFASLGTVFLAALGFFYGRMHAIACYDIKKDTLEYLEERPIDNDWSANNVFKNAREAAAVAPDSLPLEEHMKEYFELIEKWGNKGN